MPKDQAGLHRDLASERAEGKSAYKKQVAKRNQWIGTNPDWGWRDGSAVIALAPFAKNVGVVLGKKN